MKVSFLPFVLGIAAAVRFPTSKGNGGGGSPKMLNSGGPLIKQAKIQIVLWDKWSDTTTIPKLKSFIQAVNGSKWYNNLTEYSTKNYTITNRTSFIGTYYPNSRRLTHLRNRIQDSSPSNVVSSSNVMSLSNVTSPSNITDSDIRSRLSTLLLNKKVASADNNTLYVVLVPKSVKSVQDDTGNYSCTNWCGYHSTYTYNNQSVYYGVLPDLSDARCSDCGYDSTVDNASNMVYVFSHLLADMVVNPAAGLAKGTNYPFGVYDKTNGDIAEFCYDKVSTFKNYTMQAFYSNKTKTCVVYNET